MSIWFGWHFLDLLFDLILPIYVWLTQNGIGIFILIILVCSFLMNILKQSKYMSWARTVQNSGHVCMIIQIGKCFALNLWSYKFPYYLYRPIHTHIHTQSVGGTKTKIPFYMKISRHWDRLHSINLQYVSCWLLIERCPLTSFVVSIRFAKCGEQKRRKKKKN